MVKENICVHIIEHIKQVFSCKEKALTNLERHCIRVGNSLLPSPALYIAYRTDDINVLMYHQGQIIITKREGDETFSPFNHEHVKLYHEYLNKIWKPPAVPLNVFMPCTQKKPYRNSITHKIMLHYLRKLSDDGIQAMLYSISEPMLVVPYDLETFYPLSNYDFPPKLMSSWERIHMIKELRMLLPKFLESAQKNIFVLPRHHANIVLSALTNKHNHYDSDIEDTNKISYVSNKVILIKYGKLAFKTLREAYMIMRKSFS